MLFLQEGNRLVVPNGWTAFPKNGSATAVWVRERQVDKALTEKAQVALETMKKLFLETVKTCEGIESAMFKVGSQSMIRVATEALNGQSLPEHLHDSCLHLVAGWSEHLEKELSTHLGSAPNTEQIKRMSRWFAEDKVAVAVVRLEGAPMLLVSAHGESGGTTAKSVLTIAHALRSELQKEVDEGIRIILGMDSNVKDGNSGAAADEQSLKMSAKQLNYKFTTPEYLLFAGTQEEADHTVLKTRGFLQPQMKGKAGVPDRNNKDWIFYFPTPGSDGKEAHQPSLRGMVVNEVRRPSGEAGYCAGEMPRGTDFPSDHALVLVTATPE